MGIRAASSQSLSSMGQFGFGFSHNLMSRRLRRRRSGRSGRKRKGGSGKSRRSETKTHLPAITAGASCLTKRHTECQRGARCKCSSCTGKRPDSGIARFCPNPGIGIARTKLKRRLNKLRHQAYRMLCDSCRNGNLILLKELLCCQALKARSKGTDGLGRTVVNWHHQSSPLHIAAQAGQAHTVLLLIKSGADVDLVDSTGQTPLLLAAPHDHIHVVRELLAAGAALDVGSCSWNKTCIIIANAVPHHWADWAVGSALAPSQFVNG